MIPARLFLALGVASRKYVTYGFRYYKPSVTHAIEVACLLTEAGIEDGDILMAALLHDSFDDNMEIRDQIESVFGSVVCSLVEQVMGFGELSRDAALILLADEISTVRTFGLNEPWHMERYEKSDRVTLAEATVRGLPKVHQKLEGQFHAAVRECRRRLHFDERIDEEAFHRCQDDNPRSCRVRLGFANWLEERGDERADGYRALVACGMHPILRYQDDDSSPAQWVFFLPADHSHSSTTLDPWWGDYQISCGGALTVIHWHSCHEAEDDAARAFARLPVEDRKRILRLRRRRRITTRSGAEDESHDLTPAHLFVALGCAARKYRTDGRSDAVPYVTDAIEVAHLLTGAGVEEADILTASLLHDSRVGKMETWVEVESAFGPAVRRLVEQVARETGWPDDELGQNRVISPIEISTGVALIRMANLIMTLRDLSTHHSLDPIRKTLILAETLIREHPKVDGKLAGQLYAAMRECRRKLSAGESTDEEAFQNSLDRSPDDALVRTVFADWLDERGDRRAGGYRALVFCGLRPHYYEKSHSSFSERWLFYPPFHSTSPKSSRLSDRTWWVEYRITCGGDLKDILWPTCHGAEDAAARAFTRLPASERERIFAEAKSATDAATLPSTSQGPSTGEQSSDPAR